MPEEFYTKCYLLNGVDLDEDYEYTIDFDDEASQYNFFYAKKQLPITDLDFSYIRAEQPFKVDYKLSELEDIDYLMYQNEENEKWYYAFITKKEYVNPETTRLYVKLDVMQTYMFDYELKESFVDREHQDRFKLNEDENKYIPNYNIEKENLDIGSDYIVDEASELKPENVSSEYNRVYFIVLQTSTELTIPNTFYSLKGTETAVDHKIGMTLINGIPSSAYTYVIPIARTSGYNIHPQSNSGNSIAMAEFGDIDDLLSEVNVINMCIFKNAPFNLTMSSGEMYIANETITNFRGIMYALDKINNKAIIQIKNIPSDYIEWINMSSYNLDREKALDFIDINTLKNIDFETKLDTSEFGYYQIEIGTNFKQKYNLEDFNDYSMLNFKFLPHLTVNGGTTIIPLDYQKDVDYSGAMVGSSILFDLPMIQSNWKEYISQNKNSLQTGYVTQTIQTLGSIGLGVATGGMGLAVAGTQALSFGGQIANSLAKIEDIKATPDKVVKSSIDPYIQILIERLKLKIKHFTIKDNFKQKVYNYLYHYGYKCNDFKIPNIRSRYYFNYIKTIGVNLTSDISGEYKQTLKDIFNRGITIWHYRDANTFKGVNNFDYENAEMALI